MLCLATAEAVPPRITDVSYWTVPPGLTTTLRGEGFTGTSRVEFFAVATECYFERPLALRAYHAELYAVLCAFYGQDPARRLETAGRA